QCSAYAALSDIAEVMLVGHANSSDDYCIAIRGTKARKMHTSRRDTFRPINDLPLAKISSQGKLEIVNKDHKKKDTSIQVNEDTAFENKVALIKYYPGANPEILDFLTDKKYKGIVIEGTGLGHVAASESKLSWLPAIKRALGEKITVCIAPQTLYGRLNPLVYSPGRELAKLGVIHCEDMLPEVAYVKLGWVLGHTQNEEEVKHLMLTNIAGEINRNISERAFLY
ncbi:MAG: asparaginase domain-containing protein, partial [Nanoarchaeota archaeon]